MNKKAFTILEILLVISLLGILTIVIIQLTNPSQQISRIQDAQREADVFNIYSAINQYRDNNAGKLPDGINLDDKAICRVQCEETGLPNPQIDISADITPYLRLGSIPVDPLQSGTVLSGYNVRVDSQGRVIVSAPFSTETPIISTIQE